MNRYCSFNGPPVFIKVAIMVEESTSVFMLNEEELEEPVEMRTGGTGRKVNALEAC